MPTPHSLRQLIGDSYYLPEFEAVSAIQTQWPWSGALPQSVLDQALAYSQTLRQALLSGHASLLQTLLQQFPLSSQEGVALMCLAEALLRIPDPHTREQLIQDKMGLAHWMGQPETQRSLKASAALWGLKSARWLLGSAEGSNGKKPSLISHLSMPVVSKALEVIIRQLGTLFIAGSSIENALANAEAPGSAGFLHSYDMLGEAALTLQDAQKFLGAYQHAIQCLKAQSLGADLTQNPGISIKLSALHPCYRIQHKEQIHAELYPDLLRLVQMAKQANLGINLDAEEADKLELSLELLERLCQEPSLEGWDGIGFVVQAYQKRAPALLDYLLDLGQSTGHRLMIRLVKGAYWDSEIKRAQQLGLAEYPVYTQKSHTDAAYLVCAQKLLAAPATACFPQFATHNLLSIAAIQQLAAHYERSHYEFQCLYGMGEPLYTLIQDTLQVPCRRYAPVGKHAELLPYLVRRLLENGANTAFINHIADSRQPVEGILSDPSQAFKSLNRLTGQHPAIPTPNNLYGPRKNAQGWDLSDSKTAKAVFQAIQNSKQWLYAARPILATPSPQQPPALAKPLYNPADSQDCLGHFCASSPAQIEHALEAAHNQGQTWSETPPDVRAKVLEQAADLLEQHPNLLLALLVREAGKTQANAVAELREAIDFLRYYAAAIKERFCNETHRPLGVVLCISPWNFPLAIFIGQVAGALAAGNRVLAKPASQTSLIAMLAVRSLHRAGVPRAALQLLTGSGDQIGEQLISDVRVRGVVFTGSTQVARQIQYQLAHRSEGWALPAPLIAETGGLNAMIVDASAHLDQAIQDIMLSAFDSAGQRCSALRLLCVQEEIADALIERLQGAMALLSLGNPENLATDVGPLISSTAKAQIEAYLVQQEGQGRHIFKADPFHTPSGNLIPPCLVALRNPRELQQEIFGPVLHWVRYKASELDSLLEDINASGYGLTLGLHTRLNQSIQQVSQKSAAGNLYINRNQIGAVVGVQPFGGEGLSGTGPKAGGPLYPYALLSRYPWAAPLAAIQEETPCSAERWLESESRNPALMALRHWAVLHDPELAGRCEHYARYSPVGNQYELRGPTGETNSYALIPRRFVLCLANYPHDLLRQLAAALACDAPVIWQTTPMSQKLYAHLPSRVQQAIHSVESWQDCTLPIDTVLHTGTYQQHQRIARALAGRSGPIVRLLGSFLTTEDIALEWLLREQVITQNTTASGGNIQLALLNDNLGSSLTQ